MHECIPNVLPRPGDALSRLGKRQSIWKSIPPSVCGFRSDFILHRIVTLQSLVIVWRSVPVPIVLSTFPSLLTFVGGIAGGLKPRGSIYQIGKQSFRNPKEKYCQESCRYCNFDAFLILKKLRKACFVVQCFGRPKQSVADYWRSAR